VTADPGNDTSPVWTPDGQRLIFASQRGGGYNIWWQAADGTGTAERLTTNATTQGPTSISPNGRDVVFFELTAARQFDLMRLGLPTKEVSPLLQTPFSEVSAAISPDGRWLAYNSNSSGRMEVCVRPFPNVAAAQWVVSKSGGKMPAWSANELFFFDADGTLTRVPYDARSSSWHAGAQSKLLEARYYTGENVTIQDVRRLAGRSAVLDDQAIPRRFSVGTSRSHRRPALGSRTKCARAGDVNPVVSHNWIGARRTRSCDL
jgi:serine/threonine-protein kinase